MFKSKEFLVFLINVLFLTCGYISQSIIVDDIIANRIIVSEPPSSFILSTDADDPEIDGEFHLIWTDSKGADNYSIYSYNNTITELNDNLTIINYQNATSPHYFYSGDYPITIYFIVVAYNESGYTLSNCISIDITIELWFITDPFFLLMMFIGVAGVGIIYFIIRRIRNP